MTSTPEKQVLILCIDKDDDIGRKTGISSPIIGRDNVLSAAIRLSLADPEESDSNAIFASINLLDKIISQGYEAQIAVVTGSQDGEPMSSMKLTREISKVSGRFKPTDVYIVTDGFGDEDIIPVMKSRLPVSGVMRVVVKHSKSVEESYVILGRYVKMLISDERFKKYTLGLTGFSILLLTILMVAGLLDKAMMVFMMLLGFIMFVKGLDLDLKARRQLRSIFMVPLPTHLYAIRVAAFLVGYGLVLIGLILGGAGAYNALTAHNVQFERIIFNLNLLLGGFFKNSSTYLLAAVISIQLARIVSFFMGDFAESRNTMISIAVLASLHPMMNSIGDFLIFPEVFLRKMLADSLLSLFLSILSFLIITGVYKVMERRAKGS